ncbi:hypothetical protein [Myxococcus sp. AB025B]|uniref:hypothetical protein n=1 Tax=Myxococcus sp. AB025B TaxID=2562794 RepID=UPI001142CB89|nr:hypothetical protein [Myxococcus sp. AB025B]
MKHILTILRSHRLVRPMTEEEAKSISLELLRPMVREHELAMKAALADEDGLATLLHLGWMSLYAVKTSLTVSSILLHLRLLVGSKKERMDIITGCLDASFELMQKNPNSSQEPTPLRKSPPWRRSRRGGSPGLRFKWCLRHSFLPTAPGRW